MKKEALREILMNAVVRLDSSPESVTGTLALLTAEEIIHALKNSNEEIK